MKEWFNFTWINEPGNRTYGVLFRILGIDISCVFLGWLNDWKIIDLRIPANYGVYLQLFPLVGTVGRLPTETYMDVEND